MSELEAEKIKDKVQTTEALEKKPLIGLLCKHDFTFAAKDSLKATSFSSLLSSSVV